MGKRKNLRLRSGLNLLPKVDQSKVQKPKTDKKYKTSQPKSTTSAANTHTYLPFNESSSILLIGEGDFSFAYSLCLHHYSDGQKLIATSYDSEEEVYAKYGTKAEENVEYLRSVKDVEVIFTNRVVEDVDCQNLAQYKPIRKQKWDCIIWNFPHAGSGIKDVDRSIRQNQTLLQSFFINASQRIADSGVVALTLAIGEPYDSWQVKNLAKSANFVTVRTVKFIRDIFPEYEHRRTIGFDEKYKHHYEKQQMKPSNVICFAQKDFAHNVNLKKVDLSS